MAKMFYTIEEVAQKLGKSEDEVKNMAKSGQIQEFRDRDKLMFKKEQIDLLAGGDEDTGEVQLELEDTGGHPPAGMSGSGISLKDESTPAGGSGISLADSREGTGISVFDTDHGGDDAGDTQVGDTVEEELSLDAVGSGSGLLDLTRESDDTSLGAELLEEVYASEGKVEMPAGASGLFERVGAESPGNVAVAEGMMTAPLIVETYDGTWSGIGVGAMVGALIALICVAVIGIVAINGATPALATTFAGNMMIWIGGLAAVWVICMLIGLFIGRASE